MIESSEVTLLWIAAELLKEAKKEKKTPFQILHSWIARRLLLYRLNLTAEVTHEILNTAVPLAKTMAKQRNMPFGDNDQKGRRCRVGSSPTNWEAGRGRAQIDKMVQVQLARNRW